jgi:hypothetical protein
MEKMLQNKKKELFTLISMHIMYNHFTYYKMFENVI